MSNIKKLFCIETLFWLGLFALIIFVMQNHVLMADDIVLNFLTNGGITLKRAYYYGSWVMPLQNLVLYYAPYKLSQLSFIPHINLQDWAQVVGGLFESSVIFLLIKYFSKFFDITKIGTVQKLLWTILTFILFNNFMYRLEYLDIIVYSGFFRFILPSVMMCIFIFYLYKYLKNKEGNVIFLCILALLTASSSEIVGAILFVTCFGVLITARKNENSKQLMLIMLAAALGLAVLVLSVGFHSHFSAKLGHDIKNLSILLKDLLPFCQVYIKQMFLDNELFFIAFMFLLLLNIKNRDKDSYNSEIILSVSMLIGFLLFAFMLVILGPTLNGDDYWVVHIDIYSVLYLVFIIAYILLLQNIIKDNFNTKAFNAALIILILICMPAFNSELTQLRTLMSNIKDITYVRDKMVLFYLRNNEKDIILPDAAFRDNIYELQKNMRIHFYDFLYFYKFDYIQEYRDVVYDEYYAMFDNYFKHIYKLKTIPKDVKIEHINGADAMLYYENLGGTYHEVQEHKYRFSDLELK